MHGLKSEEYERLFSIQSSRCAICQSEKPGGRGWQIDHSHSTGVVRGILCFRCNLVLGMIEDFPPTARRIVEYLELKDGWIG